MQNRTKVKNWSFMDAIMSTDVYFLTVIDLISFDIDFSYQKLEMQDFK
jgi:hypothetical protein